VKGIKIRIPAYLTLVNNPIKAKDKKRFFRLSEINRESDDIPKNKKSGSEVPSNELSIIRGAKTNIDEIIMDVFISKKFFDR